MGRKNMTDKMKIGIVGCGTISQVYLEQARTFDVLEVHAVCDLVPERANAKGKAHRVPNIYHTIEAIVADPKIEMIVNLTPPVEHASVALLALEAGKSVYNEKPLAIRREDAQKMLRLAAQKGLRVGCAPDTFLGAGLQTCRKLIDDGTIGEPVGATAFMMRHGLEDWHPSPEFFYQVGGGPMFDVGPYYLTALVSLLGPVQRVAGLARISFPERVIGSLPKRGTKFQVEVPTHVTGLLEFACGPIGTIITSFDVWKSSLPWIEIYGSQGTLSLPDPNTFDGPVVVWKQDGAEENIPLLPLRTHNSRGLGVADMATAMRKNRPHRASGKMAYHVLDIMHTIHDSSLEGRHLAVESRCARPAPLVIGLPVGELD
jgi:predicted dehydrogenase